MKVNNLNNLYINNEKPAEKTVLNNQHTCKKADYPASEVTGRYNIAFCGLLKRKNNFVDLRKETEKINLEPYKEYIIPENASFTLSSYYNLSLSSPEIRSVIENLQPEQEIIFGRNGLNLYGMNSSISGKHLKISRNKQGQLTAQDLGSTNGTKYEGVNFGYIPYTDNFSSIQTAHTLRKNVKTLLPKNSQLYLGDDFTIDIEDKNIKQKLNEKGALYIGRNSDCDITVPLFYNQVSRYHLLLEKSGVDDIVIQDLGSKNSTVVIPQNDRRAFYGDFENLDLGQGNIGDCFLLSTIYALSHNKNGQKLLRNMVDISQNGDYIVKFANKEPITVKREELDGQENKKGNRKYSVSGDLGIKAIERAYAKLIKNSNAILFKNQNVGSTMFLDIDKGGLTTNALEKMTGIKSKTYKLSQNNIYNTLYDIERTGEKNHILTCDTASKGNYDKYMDPQKRFISKHAYSIKNINSKNMTLDIVNPHNTKISYPVTWEEFRNYFDNMYDAVF